MEGKFALVCDFLGRQSLADLRDKFYGQQFLAAEKTLTWYHPQGHLSLPSFVQIFEQPQTDLKTCKCFPQVLLHKLDHPWNAKLGIFEDQPTAFAGLF